MLQQNGEFRTLHFLQIKLRLVTCNHYVMIHVSILHENMLAKWLRKKNGKINDKMESIASGCFFVSWFKHDISKGLKK